MENYAWKHDTQLEVMRIPIRDDDFCGFICVRKGVIFVVINSCLPIAKQIFAAVHGLYYIICYMDEQDSSKLQMGSLLTADGMDEEVCNAEDVETQGAGGGEREAGELHDHSEGGQGARKEKLGRGVGIFEERNIILENIIFLSIIYTKRWFPMDRFINRTDELNTLEEEYNASRSSMVVLYGRRRIGKTELINQFLKKHEQSIYFMATEESEQQNLAIFKNLAAEFTGNELLSSADVDWQYIFRVIANKNIRKKTIIVIDEFQYIGQSNPAFLSVMQKIWDQDLKDKNIMLILCGSLVSMMEAQALNHDSPLYGRRTAQIKLKQIPFKYYHEFYKKKYSDRELVMRYAVTGGVPKYIESFKDEKNIYDAIRKNLLSPQNYLYEEPYFLLQKEVSEIGSYFSVIKSIAAGNSKGSAISTDIGIKQTSLPRYMKVLIDLDLVEREVPVTEKNPARSKSGQFRIKDNFIAFWFKFVYPYRSYLEMGRSDFALAQIKKGFIANYASFIYEELCREKMWEYAADGLWDFDIDKVGRYWGPVTGETDVVALDTERKHIIVGECKFASNKKGISVLNSLCEKADALCKYTGAYDVQYVIFGSGGFSKQLLQEAENNKKIMLISSIA